MTNLPLKKMIPAGLFAALTAVFSQIAIPLPFTPLPINLATLSVLLAGGLLGPRYGFISQLIYVFLGFFGLPVFAQFTGGPGILFGPTGGYIFGYVLAAWISGLLLDHAERCGHRSKTADSPAGTAQHKGSRTGLSSAAAASIFTIGALAYYLPGTLWFMAVTGSGLTSSLTMCVLPFLPGDALKIAAAVILTKRLRRALSQI